MTISSKSKCVFESVVVESIVKSPYIKGPGRPARREAGGGPGGLKDK